MNMKKKILAVTLLTSMVMGGGGGFQKVYADELTDPYIPRIRNGEIKPPQYEIRDENNDGVDDDLGIRRDSPSVDEWIKSVENQDRGNIDGVIKWEADQTEFKIKKLDQNGKPIKGVVFNAYNNKEDAENNKNSIDTATSNDEGDVRFTNLPPYYGFYIKETSVPEGYAMSEEIIPVYRDNGVRFIGEKKANDFKVSEAEEGQGLNKYLQNLLSTERLYTGQINWLVFNDNGVEKLIPKKPLAYGKSWVGINNYNLTDGSKIVTVDGKTYKIRLIRGYNDSYEEKGSEWNRLILPLIGVNGKEASITNVEDIVNNPYGRFGHNTETYVEQNMPVLAEYTWWKDFGVLEYFGSVRWCESTFNSGCSRGEANAVSGAAHVEYSNPYSASYEDGWQPILELVDSNQFKSDTSLASSDLNKVNLIKQESKNEKGIIETMKEKIGEIFRRD